ncbi:uncharacterized protein LOC122061692 [Macadamia integrifolia]|uniref:uncharacterized protein LOC122061692 n=1 Tax=Macadamia integrifolia TaxID=60698 RepID=UPI001C52F557|nr:uncharacterized protein LOC122061692 [Macadamia integrifolia]
MRHRGWLQDSRKIRVDEQLAMFMFRITGVGPTNRAVEERFQHSGQTVSYYFGKVLQGVLKLSKEYIKAPSFDEIPMEIIANNKWWPYFKDCIGAIDGTHVTAIVPKGKQIPYRGRKGITTQNVMCACSFDMKFTFVYAGWEGSANDCRVFNRALEDPTLRFPHPPQGKYYVVDSGYASKNGYLTPFKGERYHIPDYNGGRRQPRITKVIL